MSFKEQQKERIKLHEVCSDCGKAKDKNFVNSVTGLIFGAKACECKPAQALPSFPVAERQKNRGFSDESRSEVAGKQDQTQEINVNLGDRYEVIEVIGQGGMGTVYRAKDKVLQKDFAIKVLRNELAMDESAIKRFEQEAASASDLTHVNMLAVYDHGRTTSGAPFIVMDLLEGESLAQLLKRETRIESSRAVNIAIQICDALSHAHMKGLIHRDLKPSNVMLVDNNNSADLVKVLDFGIAKLMPSSNRETQNLTQTGELFGSPSYMSPEQCLACSQDARSDIYSLGCMMYEMLTGKPPFSGKNPIQTVVQHINEEPLPLGKIVEKNGLPKGLEAIVMRCLEKEAAERYQSMDQLSADLQLIAGGQAPKQKKKKARKSIDLLSAPLMAAYLTVTAIISYSGQERLEAGIPLFWCCILTPYFWRWLTTKRTNVDSAREKWKSGLVCSLFATFALWIPLSAAHVFQIDFRIAPYIPSELRQLYGFIMASMLAIAMPMTACGWFVSWILSIPHLTRAHRRWLHGALFLVPLCLCAFARPQIAWLPYKVSEILDTWSYNRSYEQKSSLTKATSQQLLTLAIMINPNFVDAYYERAMKKYWLNKASALNDFTKVFELTKDKKEADGQGDRRIVDALRMLFDIHFDSNQYELAIKDSNLLLAQTNNFRDVDADVYIGRGRCYEKLNSYTQAMTDFDMAIEKGSRAYDVRARLNDMLGNYQQALSDYSAAIIVGAEDRRLYACRAELNRKVGNTKAAMSDYQRIVSMPEIDMKAIDKNSSSRDWYAKNLYYTAAAYKALGNNKKAAELFEIAKKNGFEKPDELDGYKYSGPIQ